jgi:hypothetical protein
VAGREMEFWATLAGALAIVACCALLPAIGVGAGAFAAALGVAVRFWPVTVVGVALASWGGIRLARTLSGRRRRSWPPASAAVFIPSRGRPLLSKVPRPAVRSRRFAYLAGPSLSLTSSKWVDSRSFPAVSVARKTSRTRRGSAGFI